MKIFSSKNIYFFIPNLIGYIRILLVIWAFYYCFEQHYLFIALYSVSQLLDVFDGYTARYFRQATRYGGILDMVTDRVSIAALLIVLTKIYPAYSLLFIMLVILDIISHFFHIYSSLLQGKQSHKIIALDQHWLLRRYHARRILFTLCLGHEAYLLLLYILRLQLPSWILSPLFGTLMLPLLTYSLGVLFVFKHLVNMVQLLEAIQAIVRFDQEELTF